MKKLNLRMVVVLIMTITILFALSILVNASEENVVKIGEKEYDSLAEAVKDVPTDGTQTTITLLKNVDSGSGFVVNKGQNILIDFAGFTYDASTPTVGSTGTETNGCQLLKGSTVTMKNGKLMSTTAKILIQNYCNLTLQDMVIDGTKAPDCSYVLSNNNGKVNIIGNTSILGNDNAFDMCWAPNNGYPDGTQITVDTTGTIQGNIELGLWGAYAEDVKSTLNIKNVNHIGKFNITDERLSKQLTIEGGKFTSNVSNHVKEGYIAVKVSDEEYKVGLKATGLTVKENITMTVGDTTKLEAKVEPVLTIEKLEFSSNNQDVATIDSNGNIKAVKAGEAIITVKVGNIEKKCTVKVNAKEISIELPIIDDSGKDIDVGVSTEVEKEINEILKEEVNKNEIVKEALETGKDVKVEIKINKVDAVKLDKDEIQKIEEAIENGNVAQYFDISLLIKVNGEKIGEISEPSKELTFTLSIPKELLKEGREFYIIRIHNGKAEIIEGTLVDGKFTFMTDKFSTYALAYTDSEEEIVQDNPDNEKDDEKENNDIDNSNINDDEKDSTPKTGVINNIAFVTIIGIITLCGAIALKKRK